MKRRIFGIILAGILVSIMVGASHSTGASYGDIENSSGNTFAGWSSILWTQTTGDDFQSGNLHNINIDYGTGEAKLTSDGENLSTANLILFWDSSGEIPNGWTDISAAGQPFYNMFPRGAATYGGAGGSDVHTHNVESVSEGDATGVATGSNVTVSRSSHTHILSSVSISTESSLPSYRNLRIIRYDSGVPSTIPEGAIAIFDSIPAEGWTPYSSQNDYFIRGSDVSVLEDIGGANSHGHTASATVSGPTQTLKAANNGSKKSVATGTHTHTLSGLTDVVDSRPPYITVILARADTPAAIPSGMIGMFDAAPDSAWNVLSDVGGDFDHRFMVGSTVFGNTGGSITHDHALSSGSPSATAQAKNGSNGAANSGNHTHTMTLDSQNNLPPYCDVIVAQAVVSSSSAYSAFGALESRVLDTENSEANWDALFWEAMVPDNTALTFEVRASDISYDADDSSLEWSSIGETSPMLTDLPAGRYKQWRAVFTSPDGTDTPVLGEVRLYYTGN